MGKKVKEDKKPPPDDVVCTLYLVVLSCLLKIAFSSIANLRESMILRHFSCCRYSWVLVYFAEHSDATCKLVEPLINSQ